MDYLLKDEIKNYNQDLVAKSGIQTLYDISLEEGDVFHKLISARDVLLNNNPENVVLKNSVDYFLTNLTKEGIKEEAAKKKEKIFNHLTHASGHITQHALHKIKSNSRVFFHSINNHIYSIAKLAKQEKNAKCLVLDYSGNNIHRQLSEKLGIRLRVDLELRDILAKTDICILGAESHHNNESVVKKGSYLIAREAKEQNIPLYLCLHTLKYGAHKKDDNTHETIPNEFVTGFITEHGIFSPKKIAEEMQFFRKTM